MKSIVPRRTLKRSRPKGPSFRRWAAIAASVGLVAVVVAVRIGRRHAQTPLQGAKADRVLTSHAAGRDDTHAPPAHRSPLLQRGETLREPIPPARLRSASDESGPLARPAVADGAGEPGPVIDWSEAGGLVGRHVTVRGTVVTTGSTETARDGRIYFLNFDRDWRGKFYVVVFEEAAAAWPQRPDLYFLRKSIRVSGRVVLYRQTRPQIQVRRADQIVVE